MVGIAAALAVVAPLMVNEQGMFHFPNTLDAWRFQAIERSGNEREWPFSVDSGYLLCVWLMGDRVVYFTERPTGVEGEQGRTVVVSTNPFDLAFVNMGQHDLFAPFDGLEQLIIRLGPFENLGRRLCDQPRGTQVGPGEL